MAVCIIPHSSQAPPTPGGQQQSSTKSSCSQHQELRRTIIISTGPGAYVMPLLSCPCCCFTPPTCLSSGPVATMYSALSAISRRALPAVPPTSPASWLLLPQDLTSSCSTLQPHTAQ
jgi:hypothetical protein